MTNTNKKKLEAILSKLETIKAEIDEKLYEQVDEIYQTELDKFENMSERSREGERGQEQEALANAVESLRDQLQEISDAIDTASSIYNDDINNDNN